MTSMDASKVAEKGDNRHLTHENAVLREFVAARDAVNCHDNETAPWVFEDRMELLEVEADLRVRLAEQFGVQLP